MTEKEFILQFTSSISSEGIKKFPDEFVTAGETRELKLPGKTLIMGEEFFGKYEIITVDGTSVMQAESHSEAKYVIYAARTKPSSVSIPVSGKDIKSAVTAYEKYLDSIVKQIEAGFKRKFPDSKNLNSAINEIFRILNLTRY